MNEIPSKPFQLLEVGVGFSSKFFWSVPFDETFRKGNTGNFRDGKDGYRDERTCISKIGEVVLENPEYYCPSYKKLYAGVPDKTVNFSEYKHDVVIVNKQNNYTVLLQAAFSRIEAATSWFVRHDINENLVLTLDRKDEVFYIEAMQPDLCVSLDKSGREVPTDEANTVTYLIEKHENAIMVYGE